MVAFEPVLLICMYGSILDLLGYNRRRFGAFPHV